MGDGYEGWDDISAHLDRSDTWMIEMLVARTMSTPVQVLLARDNQQSLDETRRYSLMAIYDYVANVGVYVIEWRP